MKEKNIDLKNKRILITGAAGFIGSNLVMELLREVHPVHIIGIDNMNVITMYLLRSIVYSRLRNWQHSIQNLLGILSGVQLRIRHLLIRSLKNTSRRL